MSPVLTCVTGDIPVSGAVYDPDTDILTITDLSGSFVGLVDMVAIWSNIQAEIFAPDLVIDSPTQLRIIGLRTNYNGGDPLGFIHHIEVRSDATGSYPGITVYSVDPAIDDSDPNDAAASDMTTPANDQVQLDGLRFLTAPVNPLNSFQLRNSSGVFVTVYYDPAGPDAGLNTGTTTIVSWTDTLVIVQDTAISGESVGVNAIGGARLRNPAGSALSFFTPHPAFTIS